MSRFYKSENGIWYADISTTEKPAVPGTYNIRVRAIAGEDLGAWSGEIEVEIEA